MRINRVEKITGLTAKAIRLYESKGLISVSRKENGYRHYTDENIEALKQIKLFRSVGVAISDIKLYLFGVVTIEELMEKRRAEIQKESGKNSEKYRICEAILTKGSLDEIKWGEDFSESEGARRRSSGALSVGIDIGTTTVSAVVYDIDNKEQQEAYALPHNSYVKAGAFSEQSTEIILEKAKKLLFHILDTYEGVVCIGITGQMHGIVYIDSNGKSISNLINWQDKRADIALECGANTCQMIKNKTNESISTGYGIATHYYNMQNGLVPRGAAGICTIMDLFAMEICGSKKPIAHISEGASLGMFDVKRNEFKKDKLSLLGIDRNMLPEVTEKSLVVGECKGIPVSVPIGDNQASFLGSIAQNRDTMLLNIGTGSQISYACDSYTELDGTLELRPLIEGKYLVCGSALCGGFAYSMLEEFFRSYAVSLGLQENSQYSVMNKLATEAFEKGEDGLLVDACFCGKRSNPDLRGTIRGIDRYSFTPSALILGVLKGMCDELYELYEKVPEKKTHIVASGGAIKRTEVLKKIVAQRFNASVTTNKIEEEAATGASLFAALAIGKIKYDDGFNEYIGEGQE